MSDDFGTINVSRGERAREIAGMREHFRRHREALEDLIGDAPSEHFAQLYSRLVDEIDVSLAKLDELEGVANAPPREFSTEPGMRPLVTPPQHDFGAAPDMKPGASASRVLLIVLVALIGLAAIGWLMWRASNRGDAATGTLVDATAATATLTTETTVTTAPELSMGGLTVAPASQDFGVVRKGTRAVRTFTLRNETDTPLTIKVARSVCRCLYYQHPPVIPPKSEKTLSVTIDGAKAKAGDLRETVQVTTSDPSVKTSIDVIATIR